MHSPGSSHVEAHLAPQALRLSEFYPEQAHPLVKASHHSGDYPVGFQQSGICSTARVGARRALRGPRGRARVATRRRPPASPCVAAPACRAATARRPPPLYALPSESTYKNPSSVIGRILSLSSPFSRRAVIYTHRVAHTRPVTAIRGPDPPCPLHVDVPHAVCARWFCGSGCAADDDVLVFI